MGRVDCTKYGHICEKYKVQSYPTIAYLKNDLQVNYRGDRSLESLIDFAERLSGPDVRKIDSCSDVKSITDKHSLLILSVGDNETDLAYLAYRSLATTLKSNYWFYKLKETCEHLLIKDPGIYILKRHLPRAIKFIPDGSTRDHKEQIIDWISRESLPVFGPISSVNFDRIMSSNKLLVIAVIDEYKPARRLSQLSKELFDIFEGLAKKYAEQDNRMLFAWSSDLELIQSILIGQIQVPNAIVLKSDYSYHLQVDNNARTDEGGKKLPGELQRMSLESMITDAKSGKLTYEGGSSMMHSVLRFIYSQYNRYTSIYRANPLLALILIGFPGIIVLFVVYTTCCYETSDVNENDTRDDEDEDEEERLLDHAHQD